MELRPKLPFYVTPYPDELFGSWLYRLQLYNHSSLLLQLTEITNRLRLNKSEWRDIPKNNRALDHLLQALGITYDVVMMKLSTYPYWLRFHSARAFDWKDGGTELPELILMDRRKTISRVSYLLPNLMRVCPICLAEDIEQYGESYAHRAHLLPFVRICHKHGVGLISRCPHCNQIFRMNSTFIHTPVVCTCNFDLRCERSLKITHSQRPWEHLARYSADALFSTEAFHECSKLYKFLDSRLADYGVTKRPDLLVYLAGNYGAEAAKAMLCLSRQSSDTYTYSPIGWVSRRELRAPPICAFLATLDASFAHSQALFAHFTADSDKKTNEEGQVLQNFSHPLIPQSVTEARSYVAVAERSAGRKSITRSFLYKRYKKLFWYLVLFDREWFDNHFPPGGWGATEFLPSIETDRISILRAIEKATRHSVKIWANLAQQAYFRASLRDGQWLEDRKQDTILQAHKDKQWQQQEHLRECTDEIQRGIEIIRAAHGTPPNISPAVIAPYTALNESQIRHFLANNPDIRAYLGKKTSPRNSN